jgi:hypothetical protein
MKKATKYAITLFALLVCSAAAVFTWQAFAQSSEKRKALLETALTIEAGEQKFTAFYLPEPNETFQAGFNVSQGKIKCSIVGAEIFEDSLGYYDTHYENGTLIKTQYWLYEGSNETIGGIANTAKIYYLLFYNEDTYQKTVTVQVTTP